MYGQESDEMSEQTFEHSEQAEFSLPFYRKPGKVQCSYLENSTSKILLRGGWEGIEGRIFSQMVCLY